jgi:hypothetical protein
MWLAVNLIHTSFDYGTGWELAWRVVVWIVGGIVGISFAAAVVPAFLEGWREPRRQTVGTDARKP